MQIQVAGWTPDAPTTTVALYYPTMAAPRAIAMGPFALDVAIGAKPIDKVKGLLKGLLLLSHGIGGSELGSMDGANGHDAGTCSGSDLTRALFARRRCSRYHAAGTTSMLSRGAVTMPPTIGAAIRLITSEPVPLPHMIGSSPAMTTATVIALGRTRSTAPSRIAASSVASSSGSPAARRWASAFFRYTSMTTCLLYTSDA